MIHRDKPCHTLKITQQTQLSGFSLEVDLALPASGFTVLFGPSGCGKTTLLRCIAGLHHPVNGVIKVNGATWQDKTTRLKAHQRDLGYVFQEPSLFDHLDVTANLLYGYKRATSKGRLTLEHIAQLLGIEHLLTRKTAHLSGGEKQRVAIGRALLSNPKLLLMDEPLSALDHKTKNEVLPYLERLPKELSIPIIYVTHALSEVERLADHLVIIEKGRVIAEGDVHELMLDLDGPLSHFNQAGALVDAIVTGYDSDYSLTELTIDGGILHMPTSIAPIGSHRRIRIGASHVSLSLTAPTDSSIINCLAATVIAIKAECEAMCIVRLQLGETSEILARITKWSKDHLGLQEGLAVYAQIKGASLIKQ